MKSFTVTIKAGPESKTYDFDLISDYNRFVYYISVDGKTVHVLESETIENSYVELARYINSQGLLVAIAAGPDDRNGVEILKTHIRISRSMKILDTLGF